MPNANDSGWASTVVVGSLTGIALTVDWMPQQVVAGFALGGDAGHAMVRDQYLACMVAGTLFAAALAAGLLCLVVLRFPELINLPNRDFWLAPERRVDTTARVTARAAWLAAIVSLLGFGLHLLVLRANQRAPAALDTPATSALLLAFCAAVAAWYSALRRAFGRTSTAAQ